MHYSKRNIKLFVLLAICCFKLISCGNSSEEISFSIENKQINHFSEIGRIEKVMKLESSYDALFVEANRVRIDKDGHLYILDQFSQESVFHFDDKGNFLNKYGQLGQGPGEYNALDGFDIDSVGKVVLLSTFKLIKFEKSGEFLSEKKINVSGADIKSIGNELFVYVLRNRETGRYNRNAIKVYNSSLNLKYGVGTYDSRLLKYRYIPTGIFDGNGSKLFFIDIYNLSFNIYDNKINKLMTSQFSNRNRIIEDIWKKSTLTEDDRSEIKRKIHRFNNIYFYKNSLFLVEINRSLNSYYFWLLDLKNNKIKKYPLYKLINDSMEPDDNFYFDYIAGSYENGLILIINNCDGFNKYKSSYPKLNNIEYGVDDNPLVVFFSLNN